MNYKVQVLASMAYKLFIPGFARSAVEHVSLGFTLILLLHSSPAIAQWTPHQISLTVTVEKPIKFFLGSASSDSAVLQAGSIITLNVNASSAKPFGTAARVRSSQILPYLQGTGSQQINIVSAAPGSTVPSTTTFGRIGTPVLRKMIQHNDFSITQSSSADASPASEAPASPNTDAAVQNPQTQMQGQVPCVHCSIAGNLGGEDATQQIQTTGSTVSQAGPATDYDGFTAAQIESFRRNITPASLARYAQSAKVQNFMNTIHRTDLRLNRRRRRFSGPPNYRCYHYFKEDAYEAGMVDPGSLLGRYAYQAGYELQGTHQSINLLDHHIFPDGRFDYLKDKNVLSDPSQQRRFMGVTLVHGSNYPGLPHEGDIQTVTPYGFEGVWVNPAGPMENQHDGYKYFVSGAMIDPSVLTDSDGT